MAARPTVSVVGVSGYTGGELARLLSAHPDVDVVGLGGRESVGKTLVEVHPGLRGSTLGDRRIVEPEALPGADVVLLALPHEESASTAPASLERGSRVVDLSGAFRLAADAYPTWYGFEHPAPAWLDKAVYGLPERWRTSIADASLVANPGCFPTAAVLALAPLVDAGLIAGTVAIDGKTGVSGAGRASADVLSIAHVAESIRPYRFPRHQHTPEIERALGDGIAVSFVPHLVPAVRGVVVTCFARATEGTTDANVRDALSTAYAIEPFVRTLGDGEMPDTRRVRGTNLVEVVATLDVRTSTVVALAALDNLVKGAAGQAIQNLNLLLGIDETTNLPTVGIVP